tara:strand:+ start:172 stop:333 length:162 start_codon:yes stop_codon:yes gene_type:complete
MKEFHAEHLTEMEEIEQERDHYRERYETVQKELEEVKKELNQIKQVYFKDGHY